MSTTITPRRAVQLSEKLILGFIAGAAAAIAVTQTVLLVARIVEILSGAAVPVSMPLMDAPMPTDSDAVTEASYDSATLLLASVPASARGMLIFGDVLVTLLPIGACVVVAWLCLLVFHGRPFVRSAGWGIGAVAILVVVSGIGGAVVHGVANAQIADAVELAGTMLPTFLAAVPLAPLGWAAALAVVAGAFEIGQRMQRDTERLV
ncbi:hypothetical protein [Microbacterium soli]|uniref:DUF2975 domain-containing protein n=1 Tax=Microbacterium soli TaxID=446075 RepID=A0ABP7N888_9MICO